MKVAAAPLVGLRIQTGMSQKGQVGLAGGVINCGADEPFYQGTSVGDSLTESMTRKQIPPRILKPAGGGAQHGTRA